MKCAFMEKFGWWATSSICEPYPNCEGCPYCKKEETEQSEAIVK